MAIYGYQSENHRDKICIIELSGGQTYEPLSYGVALKFYGYTGYHLFFHI